MKNTVIRFKDGFTGTAAVDQPSTAPADTDTTLEIDTLANLPPDSLTIIPVGVRFTVVGSTNTYTVTVTQANEQQLVDVDTGTGNFKLTFTDPTGVSAETADIAYDATAAQVQAALILLSNIDDGDVIVTGTTPEYLVEFKGQYLATNLAIMTIAGLTGGSPTVTEVHAGATTWKLTFLPALATADGIPVNDAVITLFPQQLDIKIGDGNVTYTEANEYEYDLDRGVLDTVRAGDQVPMDVSLDFVYEYITTGTGEEISPMDALKKIGGAALWVTSSSDPCGPYSIDVEVVHTPICTTQMIETTIFPDFRSESREPDLGEATVSVSGRCNATQPSIERTSQ